MMKKVAELKLSTWLAVTAFTVLFFTAVICTAADGILQVTVEKEAQNPIEGITVYLFNENGTYLNQNQVTDSAGNVEFNLSEGTYKIRADYLGYQFWSQIYSIDGDISGTLTIAHQDITITVQGEYQGLQPLSGLQVYLFTESGAYQSQARTTNESGQVFFSLPERAYKVRADYLGQQFWSDPFTWQNTPVTVPMSDAEITVTGAGLPLEGVNVYVFSSSGSYLSMSDTTGSDGKVIFRLPAGAYKFRADYQSSQYWTDEETLTAGQVNPISISTGGGALNLTVLKGPGNPLTGVNCYAFSEAGTYLGMSAATDSNGQVAFNLSDGSYKIRVDYLGYQFWSKIYSIDGDISGTLTIAHQDITITVQGEYQGMQPLAGLPVYLFTESGAYQSHARTTNANGQVFFNLPEQSYKVRADYLGRQFWSDPFTWQNTPVSIPMSDAEITVTGAGLPLEGVNVYVFSSSGSYLSMSDTTGSDGKVTFRLPAGAYKFRADYQSSQYWTDEETITAGQVNPISISTGGGALSFTVLKGPGNPLTSVNCYVFNEAGTYLGMSAATDSNGQVAFNLSDGSYKIRVDYLGYQFWSQVYSVAGDISGTLTIAHQDITITVQGEYQGMQPLAGLPVYLFTESGAYQSQARTTNADGQVFFNLPERAYKVRADYLGQQFWSDPFTWQNTPVTIQEGMVEIHITRSGVDVNGARVYLFNQSGSYLSRYETTDATGKVQFRLPSRIYKFRADEGGDQAWSSEIQITAGIVNNVSIDFSPVSVIISAAPETIHVGQTSTLTWNSTNADSATIDQGIGSVAVSGSTVVSPAETTTYTITVTGTQGSAVASTTVTVTNNPPVAVDDFISTDEDMPITAIAVLANDSDPDGDTVSIRDFTQPSHGTAGSNGDGTLTYTPDADFNGSDSFTYTITDGTSESPPATVTITINPVNDPPVANAGADQSVNRGDTVSLDGTLSSDVDGNVLTYQWAFVSLPQGSSAALSDPAAANPTFTADVTGTYELQLVVNDGTVDGPPDAVTITAAVPMISVPDVTGLVQTEAESQITAVGLAVGTITTEYHTAVLENHVISQNPIAETSVEENSTVDLIVSLGPAPALTVGISAYPEFIQQGESSTLTWSSTNADSADIDQGIGSVPVNGTITVSPAETTVYTIMVIGPGGSSTASTTVTVNYPPPLTQTELPIDVDLYSFGYSVDISGNYTIVAAGSSGAGVVLIYKREGSVWIQQARLIPDDFESGKYYAHSVGVSGDYAVIGATNTDNSTGEVYIFKREGDVWNQQQKLVSPIANDDYGESVSIDGDYVIVGASHAPAGDDRPGAAYIFKREGDSWAQQAKLSVADHPNDYNFGKSVTIHDDYAIIGATDYAEHPVYTSAYRGCAFIFKRTGSVWIEQAKLIAGNDLFDSSFGYSVAIHGEYAMAGGSNDENDLGAVYIYKYDGTAWTKQVKFAGDNIWGYGGFGYSVALHEGHAVVGAPWAEPESGYYPLPGAAYLFKLGENGWELQQKVYGTPGGIDEIGPEFGTSVAMDGAYFIVGAPYTKNENGEYVGAAYIYFNGDTTVTIDAAPSEIVIGQSATLSWTSINADTVTIDQGIGDVDVNGSITVTPGQTTTYSITATGAGGNETDHVTISVIPPVPPVVSFNTLENRIDPGNSTTLWWNTTYADSCSIAPAIGIVNLNDSITVSPAETTTYTITATGPGGTTTETVNLIVAFEPTVNITAAPETISPGESSTLTWSSTYADSVTIEPDIGNVDLAGSLDVSPLGTTVYTITATGPGGTSSGSTTVQVQALPPVATLTAEPDTIDDGESSTLTWDTTYADSVIIEPDVGSVGLSGSVSVSPTSSTNYTLTATGPYGSAQRSVTVTVQKLPGIYYEYDALGRIKKIIRIPK